MDTQNRYQPIVTFPDTPLVPSVGGPDTGTIACEVWAWDTQERVFISPWTGEVMPNGWTPDGLYRNYPTFYAPLRCERCTSWYYRDWDPDSLLGQWCMQYLRQQPVLARVLAQTL